MLCIKVLVNLRGSNTRMTQKLTDIKGVNVLHQQLSGKCVAKHMRRKMDLGALLNLFHHSCECTVLQLTIAEAYKEVFTTFFKAVAFFEVAD